jgi:hypothetical protein
MVLASAAEDTPMSRKYARIAAALFAGVLAGMPAVLQSAPAEAKGKSRPTAAKVVSSATSNVVLKKPFGGRTPQPITIGSFRLPGQVIGPNVNVATTSGMHPQFWAGVNLGATLPGTSPGELAPTRADYDRWLQQMGELGATSVRIYTILRPTFYDALRAYNLAHTQDPIFVLAGVWVPEDEMLHTQNAYDPDVVAKFRAELADAVAAVHGDLVRPVKIGHARGTFTSDISHWVLAYSIGVEWDPGVVENTNKVNPTSTVDSATGAIRSRSTAASSSASRSSEGTYIVPTADANPMERWIASMLDHVAILEAKRGWSRPLTYTNWVTADPIRHPEEPFEFEDSIVVDAKHMAATPAWPGGFFASYHAYPYYPDGLRFQTDYLNYRRPSTNTLDAYAGYIHALHLHHGDQPVMITEFGQPSSIGIAHRGPNGRDQGGHSEQQAGINNADIMRIIADEGFAGGMVFEWLDEWFKFTWNSVEHELPKDRRSMWRNPLTNEEHFGILALEAGATQKVVIDGKDKEWTREQSQMILESRGSVAEVRATHDEESLYLRIRFAEGKAGTKVGSEPWAKEELAVGLQVFPEGNKGLPGRAGVSPESNVAILVGPGNVAKLRIASWMDTVQFEFGVAKKELPFNAADLVTGSGAWAVPQQIVSRALTVPSTNEKLGIDTIPFGDLRWGTTDPKSPNFDDRALVNGSKNVLELRIPWGMIGLSDPSSKLRLRPKPDGTMSSEPIERIGINVVGPKGEVAKTSGYAWEAWNRVTWHERKKAGWPYLQKVMNEYR